MNTTTPSPIPEEAAQLLLRRIIELYEKNLAESEAARALLQRWQISNHTFLGLHHVGYSNSGLTKILNEPALKSQLIQLGILTAKGAERLTGCLIFPLYDATGAVVDFWCVPPSPAQGKARFLLNRPLAFWNFAAAKLSSVQYVVTSPIDGFALLETGFGNVIGLYPDRGQPEVAGLESLSVQRLVIVLGDNSESEIIVPKIRALLKPYQPEVIMLPNSTGPNDFLTKRGQKALAEAIVAATHHVPAVSIPNMRPLPDGFILPIGNLHYTVNGLEQAKRQLLASIRVERGEKVWADTFNLRQATPRTKFVGEVARIMGEPIDRLEADMNKLMEACEVRLAQPDLVLPDSPVDPVPEGDRREAEVLGKDPHLVERIIEDFRELGAVGEEFNIVLSYLVMTSRKMDEPLSGIFNSTIGTGKSYIAERTGDLCPPEDLFYASFLSGKALYHVAPNALQHKFAFLEEYASMRQALQAIRMLLSSGGLTSRTATRDQASGRLQTESKRVEGPVAMLITGSDPAADRETLSRFIVSSMDESKEQTKAINERQLHLHTVEGLKAKKKRQAILRRHHAFQRLLQSLWVFVPNPEKIRCMDDRLNSRRDFPKILRLVMTIAFLRQMQKEVSQREGLNCIEVDDYDLALAAPLVRRLFSSRNLREVTQPSRDLLLILHRMERDEGLGETSRFSFTRRMVREYAGLPDTNLHRSVHELEDFEMIVRDTDTNTRRRPFRYKLDWSPFTEKDSAAVVFPGVDEKSTAVPAIFQMDGGSQNASS